MLDDLYEDFFYIYYIMIIVFPFVLIFFIEKVAEINWIEYMIGHEIDVPCPGEQYPVQAKDHTTLFVSSSRV